MHRLFWLCGVVAAPALCSAAASDTAPQPFQGDERLQVTIDLDVRRETVPQVLQRITNTTAVPLRVEGKAAELRLSAFLREAPLEQTLSRMALLLNLTWRRTGEGDARAYVLFQSEGNRLALEREREAARERRKAQARRYLQGAVDPSILRDTPVDRAVRDQLNAAPVALAGKAIGMFPSAMIERVLAGERVHCAFTALPPAVQAILREQLRTSASVVRGIRAEAAAMNGVPAPVEREPPPLEESTVAVSYDGGFSISFFRQGRQAGGLSFPIRELCFDDRLKAPRHFLSREIGLEKLAIPELSGTVDWEQFLASLARAGRLNIMAEALDPSVAFSLTPDLWLGDVAKGPLDLLLDRICFYYEAEWNAAEAPLLFRRQQWWLRRDEQIPPDVAAYWQRLGREKQPFPASELTRMAALNPKQQAKLERYAGKNVARAIRAPQSLELLRFYGALRPTQRQQAERATLGVEDLDLPQRGLLTTLVTLLRPEASGLGQAFTQLEVRTLPTEPAVVFTLRFRDNFQYVRRISSLAEPLPDPWSRGHSSL